MNDSDGEPKYRSDLDELWGISTVSIDFDVSSVYLFFFFTVQKLETFIKIRLYEIECGSEDHTSVWIFINFECQ